MFDLQTILFLHLDNLAQKFIIFVEYQAYRHLPVPKQSLSMTLHNQFSIFAEKNIDYEDRRYITAQRPR